MYGMASEGAGGCVLECVLTSLAWASAILRLFSSSIFSSSSRLDFSSSYMGDTVQSQLTNRLLPLRPAHTGPPSKPLRHTHTHTHTRPHQAGTVLTKQAHAHRVSHSQLFHCTTKRLAQYHAHDHTWAFSAVNQNSFCCFTHNGVCVKLLNEGGGLRGVKLSPL